MSVIAGSAFPDVLNRHVLLGLLVGLKPIFLMPIFLLSYFFLFAKQTILCLVEMSAHCADKRSKVFVVQALELGHAVPLTDWIALICMNEPTAEVAFYIPWALK